MYIFGALCPDYGLYPVKRKEVPFMQNRENNQNERSQNQNQRENKQQNEQRNQKENRK